MKLVSKDAALAMLLIEPDEVRPMNGLYLPELFRQIGERYELQQRPTVEDARKTGAKFGAGRFISADKEIYISELGVFNDGFSVTTTDTEDAELVLNDLFAWLRQSFRFREPLTKAVRVFQSDLIVDFDNDPMLAVKTLAPVIALIQQEIEAISGSKMPLLLNRLGFACDPSLFPGVTTEFGFERRAGAPWSANRYFCKAHIRTAAHIRALELLDASVAAR